MVTKTAKQKLLNIIKEQKNKNTSNLFKDGWCYNFELIIFLNIPNTKIYFDKKIRHYLVGLNNELFDTNGFVSNIEEYPNKLELDNTKKDLLNILKGK